MNSFIKAFRAQNPNDPATDEELVLEYGDKYPSDQFPSDFVADYQRLKTGRAVESSGLGTELKRGFARGLTGLESSAAGAMALAADMTGEDAVKDYWLNIYKRKVGESATADQPSVPTVQQATGSLSAAGQYVAGKIGELVPNVGEALVGAAAGTALAPGPGTEAGGIGSFFARNAARSAIRRTIEKGLTADVAKELEDFAAGKIAGDALSKGAAKMVADTSKYLAGTTASAANFGALGAGGGYGTLAETPGVSPEDARAGALISGAGASIGALIPAHILKGLFGESVGETAARSYVDLYAKKVPSELLTAGSGMGAMEFFNVIAEHYADPEKRGKDFSKEDYSRILNAAAVGVMAGVPAAGISAIRGVKREPGPVAPKTPAREEPPPAAPEAAAGAGIVGNYPVPPEAIPLLRRVAEMDVGGKINPEEVEAYLAKNPGQRLAYQKIKAEVTDALTPRTEQKGGVGEHKRTDAQLQQEAQDRERAAQVKEKGPSDGDSNLATEAEGGIERFNSAVKQAADSGKILPIWGAATGTRPSVFVKIGNGYLPFYRSSMGTGGAKKAGEWQPFFGFGDNGWLIKGDNDDIKSDYGIPEITEARNWLNKNFNWPHEMDTDLVYNPDRTPLNALGKGRVVGQALQQILGASTFEHVTPDAGSEAHINSILDRLGLKSSTLAEAARELDPATQAALGVDPKTGEIKPSLSLKVELLTDVTDTGVPVAKKGDIATLVSFDENTRVGIVRFQNGKELEIPQWYLTVLEDQKGEIKPAPTAPEQGKEVTTDAQKEIEKRDEEGLLKSTQPEVKPAAVTEPSAAGIQFSAESFAPEAPSQFLHGTNLEQKNPLQLRVAIRKPSGEVVAGKPGDLHFNLSPAEGDDLGFVLPDGKYLTRTEASIWQFSPWLSNVTNAISAWRTPREGKAETDMYSDLGRDPKNKSKTRALGVFKTPFGKVVVASIYDNNGKKVFIGNKGRSWKRTIEGGGAETAFEPVGYIKTEEPQEKFYREYTPEQWADIQRQLESKRDTAKAEVLAEPAPVTPAAAAESGLKPEGKATVVEPKGSITGQDAKAINDLVIEHVGGFPKADEVPEMVSDALTTDVGIQERLREIAGTGKDAFGRLLNRIFEVYERAAESGETDLGAIQKRIARELEGIDARERKEPVKPGAAAPSAVPKPAEPPREHLVIADDLSRDHDSSSQFQAKARSIFDQGGTAYDVLSRLLKAGMFQKGVSADIASELLKLGEKGAKFESGGRYFSQTLGKEAAGRYDPTTDTVHVYDRSFERDMSVRTFLHEYVHALTHNGIESGREWMDLRLLYTKAREEAKKQGLDFYGLRMRPVSDTVSVPSHHEFIAEAFTNKRFQDFLNTIPTNIKERETLWSRFVDFVGKLLGIKNRSVLADVIRLGGQIASERPTLAQAEYLGGPKIQVPESSRTIQWKTPAYGSKDTMQTYNPVTGQIDTVPLMQDSVAAVLHNVQNPLEFLLPAPGGVPPVYTDPAIRLNREASINNEVSDVRGQAAAEAGIEAEAFRKLNGLTNTGAIHSVLVNEAQVKGAGNFKPDQRIADFRHEENSGPSYVRAVRQITAEMGKVAKHLAGDKELKPKVEAQRDAVLKAADEHLDRYKDAQFMADQIEKGVRQLTKDDLRKAIQTSRALGTILQQVQDIDGRMGQPVDPRVVAALRKLFTGDELNGSKLFEILDYMANDPGINWQDKASTIRSYISTRAQEDPTLHIYNQLQSDTPEGKALLSTVIAYGKIHGRTVAELQMRRMQSGEQRVALEQQLKDIWKETREQIDTGIRRVAKGAKLEEVARAEYRRTLGYVMKANRDLEHLDKRIDANEKAIPVYKRNLDRLAGKISQTEDSTFGDGMVVRIPRSLDAKPQWEEKSINLNSAAGPVTTPAEIKSMADGIAVWTKMRELAALAGDETALGLDYQRAKRQLNEIINNRFYESALRNTDHYTTELVLSSARKKLDAIGTPTGNAIATKVGQFQSDNAVFRNQADKEFGYKNPRLKRNLLGIVNRGRKFRDKVDPSWFTQYVLNTAFGFLEKGQPPEGMDRNAYRTKRFQQLGDWLLRQDHIAPLIADRMPQFMGALRELADTRHDSGQFWHGKNVKAGMLVEEPKLGGQLRQPFSVGAWTFQRKFSDMYFNMVHALRLSGWAGNGKDQPGAYEAFKQVAKLYAQDPNSARALAAKYFDHPVHGDTVRNDFLFKITHAPDESSIETPALDDSGTTMTADPVAVARAYDEAGGDVIGIFERLHDYYNGQNARADYIQDGLLGLAQQFMAADAALKKVEPRGAAELQSFVGLIPNAMIDARQFQHWPSEWFDYHEFDRNDNARMAERVAGQIHFGRDTRVLANLHQTLKDETDAMTAKLNDVLTRASRFAPTGKKAAIDREAEKILSADTTPMLGKFKTGREKLEYLRKVKDRAPFVEGFLRDMTDYYNRGNQADGSLRWGIRLAQELASLLVNQPSSAISQLATMFDIPVQWGASPTMLGRTARTIQLTAKDLAGSLAQAVGWKFLQLGEYERRFMELGLQDPEAARRAGDIFSTLEGEQQNRAAQAFRVVKDIQSFPVNLRREQAQYTPLRPLAPFFQTVVSANRALTVSLWELADNYVSKGVRYLQSHPGTGKITADMLGLRGLERDGFERWSTDIERYGLRYTEMADAALQRLNSGDKTVLTNADLSRLYSLGLNEISLESNIATMPLSAFNNKVLRFVLPLLGWSYRRAVQLAGTRLNAQDQRSLKSLSTAMLGLAATGLGGLGLSLVVDKYSEDVLGKKRNIRNLRVPTTANDWQGIQERLNRVGTLGLFGEALNGAVNVGTGQGDNRMLSVDQRVVSLQAFQGIQKAISVFINQGFDPDYRNVVRPMVSSLGGNGMLQYMQIINHAFDLDNVESRVVKRINAENYLRVVGRDLGMSIRTGGGGYATPTPITPWIARMEYAAYANDPAEFRSAYDGAKAEAKDAGKPDPADYVKKAFETRHPLRYVFAQVPSEREYRQVLANLDGQGQESVQEAVRLFNYYGSHIGLTPFNGSVRKDQARFNAPERAMAARLRALGVTP